MKKVLIEGIANTILIILFALTLIHPFSHFKLSDSGLEFTLSVYTLLFFVFMILFGIVSWVFIYSKLEGTPKDKFKEALFAVKMYQDLDERDILITNRATKTGYASGIVGFGLGIGVLIVIRALDGLNILSFSVDYYSVAIGVVSSLMIIMNVSFTTRWWIEYRK